MIIASLIYCVRGSVTVFFSQTSNPGNSFTNLCVMESDGLNYSNRHMQAETTELLGPSFLG